jgi:hypothetical protein
MPPTLLVGAAEVDITPPIGTLMAGSLQPRPSIGVYDPLFAKVLVLDDGALRLAYVVFDLCVLDRATGDRIAAAIAQRTGIPAERVIWTCTHTHNGPCTIARLTPSNVPDPVNHAWLDVLAVQVAEATAEAITALQPMTVTRARAYVHGIAHTRRLRYKDGRAINTWLLHQGEDEVQCLGAEGPIDPEVGIFAFRDMAGTLQAVLFHVNLHVNSRWGNIFSGDYPAVVAARLREHYGPQVRTLFMPGACGDQNPVRPTREIGDLLADAIIARIDAGGKALAPVLGFTTREISVPTRDVFMDQSARLEASQWDELCKTFFRDSQRDLQAQGITSLPARLSAWSIGDVAFPTFPGELFVALGQQVKAESPFPWTYPIELVHGCLGYLIPEDAWHAGGYEALISSVTLVAPAGCAMMVEEVGRMLGEMTGLVTSGGGDLPTPF